MAHCPYEDEGWNGGGEEPGEDAAPAEVGADAEDIDGTIDAGFARSGKDLEEMGIKIEMRAAGTATGSRSPSRQHLASFRRSGRG